MNKFEKTEYDRMKADKDDILAGELRKIQAPFLELLKRARIFVAYDAQMCADITRFAPLDAVSQAAHDSTQSESEKLLVEIDAVLPK